MFQVLEKILRPPSTNDVSYSKAVELVSDIEERLTKCYDDALLMLPGKERVCEKLTGECNKLTKQCCGDEFSWPAYEVATPDLLKDIDERWVEAFKGVGNSVGLRNNQSLRVARRKYAQSIADMFLELGAAHAKTPEETRRWKTYASRALILLSHLGPSRATWPLPTASTLQQAQDMLSQYNLGITEVRVFELSSSADTARVCYRQRAFTWTTSFI